MPWGVIVNTLVGTGVDTCSGFRLDFGSPLTCTTIETWGASAGGLWSASGDSAPDADITCKINMCKKSKFTVLSFFSSIMAVFLD